MSAAQTPQVAPDAFAAVMATGIVSVAVDDQSQHLISTVLAVSAAGLMAVLTVLAAVGWRRSPPDLAEIDVVLRLFTFVAACTVLAVRFAGSAAGWPLTVAALAVWLALMVVLLARMRRIGWHGLRGGARGAWELASVATSGLAIAFGELRIGAVATVFWLLGLAWYVVMTMLILQRMAGQGLRGYEFTPDTWILMGALAISTLAGVHVHLLWPSRIVVAVTIAAWTVASLWILFLLHIGLRLLPTLATAGAFWALVFPLGMYSSATYALADELGWDRLQLLSAVLCWVALAAWCATAVRFVVFDRR